jgi:XTP/dITP diphosphohydrolase
MAKLLENLKGEEDRSAQFKTVVALSLDTKEISFKGICKGEIIEHARGENGFGYDPIFQPNGYNETFAEMELTLKGEIGHRGKAMKALIGYLSE